MSVDHSAMTDQLGDEDGLGNTVELELETKLKAQKVVASHSDDAKDCAELLLALGLHPNQLKEESCTTTPIDPMSVLSTKWG